MKIMIVEGDVAVQNFLKQGFRYKQCSVDQSYDGMEGLKRLMGNRYDIAIVDMMLPRMDGGELIQKMRESGIQTPVIVLSSLKDSATKTRLFDIGADDFMTKPFSFEELYARILAIVRRIQHRVPTEHLEFSDLKLVPENRAAFRQSKKIDLRKKEYSLLEYFMQHPRRVVSREELMQNVWDYQSMVLSNTVDSHVSSLRQKIHQGHAKPLIRTVYGIGYMLSDE
jgi:two-component system, OmpR family, response regulator